ncbi:mandelate racemase/muconate lactonizing enzyme family protein [Egibacter rhizosphaerae]|uniref:Mandelate racemase/muconate lactonizing enzyme family protein n=1 Tax=Egibacter rhizosphaerae TaxID=1670831 RepID=A0A411YH11_9ACTN|nr:mandelate racemase/muconate lactonizing enzyme family protein [Egibacter rhizosphaerae]QBI20520.1 mandelate racemase/muconate lactonizing enzyme family protein [Egibacter rhizosphaerae]
MVAITRLETHIVDVPLKRVFLVAQRPIARATEVVVKVHTDEGVTGVGHAHGTPLERVAEIIQTQLGPLLVGEDPRDIERHWQRMFATTTSRSAVLAANSGSSYPKGAGRPQVMSAIGGIDIALWDLLGKLTGLPTWRLLGGCRSRVPAYATAGYYREEGESYAELAKEFEGLAADGFRRVKLKVGGVEPEEDVKRAQVVRDAIGPDVALAVDASQGWDVQEAVRAGKGFAGLGVDWYEEPVSWYDDIAGIADMARYVPIPVCSGESEYTKQGVRDLIIRAGIAIANFDCTKAGGFTEGRKIAGMCEAHNVAFAPHHAAQAHAHLTAGVPNGMTVELHPDPDRDPLWDALYPGRPELYDGDLVLSDRPGLGYEIDEEALARFGTPYDG